ncbi:hypothetical protein V6N13_040005 [Hibiscus sabdariffa]|uniref:Uncharacterized protein n=1 Tax=Hibiscus sabdariffa TaxID=183260 RepID=A0ABR2STQ1_9ROSI
MESQTSVNKESKNPSCSSSRRRSRRSHSSSLEFEFWMVRNPYFPQHDLISADELFFNGILRPLHLLPNKRPEENPPASEPEPEPTPLITSEPPTPALSSSKRWKDIFKKEKSNNQQEKDKEKKKKEKKSQNQSRGCPAELHINIWPFSRSRSADTSGTRPRTTGARKVSSNSSGESKSRNGWSNPSRAGVQLGRSSPVWQVRPAVRNSDAESAAVKRKLLRLVGVGTTIKKPKFCI